MKKTWICVSVWLLIGAVLLSGCAAKTEGSPLFPAGEIVSVHITSLPSWYDGYTLEHRDAARVVEYLEQLTLIENFEENPQDYNGMAWVIELYYADGSQCQVVHFGNKFIYGKDVKWYKMHYNEAAQFEMLLEELCDFSFPPKEE